MSFIDRRHLSNAFRMHAGIALSVYNTRLACLIATASRLKTSCPCSHTHVPHSPQRLQPKPWHLLDEVA